MTAISLLDQLTSMKGNFIPIYGTEWYGGFNPDEQMVKHNGWDLNDDLYFCINDYLKVKVYD